MTCVGALTLRLVREAGPDASLEGRKRRGETTSTQIKMGIKTLQTGVPEFSLNIIAGAPSGGKNSGSKNSRSSSTNTPSATSFGIDFGIGLDTPQREGKLKLFYISLGTCRSMRRCAPSSTRCRR